MSKANGVQKYLQVGTDEVYGTLPEDKPEEKFTEETAPARAPQAPTAHQGPQRTRLPVRSYFHTFKMPVLTTGAATTTGVPVPETADPARSSPTNGGRKVPLYGDGLNVRDWLTSRTTAMRSDGAEQGTVGEVYNVGATTSCTIRKITETILREMGKNGTRSPVRERPPGSRPPLRDRRVKDQRELGWEPSTASRKRSAPRIRWLP